jgi:signal peptidase
MSTIDVHSPVRYAPVYHPRYASALQSAAASATAPAPVAEAPATRARRWPRRLGRAAGGIGWLIVISAALVMVIPTLLGYDRYVIVSGSMHPILDRGSIVYSKPVPTEDLEVGDVITYLPPAQSGVDHLVTHRIASISTSDSGQRVYRTKGDANPGMDPWVFELDTMHQNTMRFDVPVLGYALIWLSDPHIRIYVIGIPAGIIALMALLELLGIEPRLPRLRRAGGQPAAAQAA